MEITKVAQEVQRSAFPEAYADHEPEGRVLASALTGHSPGGLELPAGRAERRPATRRPRSPTDLKAELGVTAARSPADARRWPDELAGRAPGPPAPWAVARAEHHGATHGHRGRPRVDAAAATRRLDVAAPSRTAGGWPTSSADGLACRAAGHPPAAVTRRSGRPAGRGPGPWRASGATRQRGVERRRSRARWRRCRPGAGGRSWSPGPRSSRATGRSSRAAGRGRTAR